MRETCYCYCLRTWFSVSLFYAGDMAEQWTPGTAYASVTIDFGSNCFLLIFSLSFFPFSESDFNFFMLFLNVAVQIENNQTIQVCVQTWAALRDLESCCWLSGSKQRRGLQGLSSGRSRGRRCRGATGGGEELGQQEVTGAKWHHPDHPDISPYTQLGRSKEGKKGVDVWHHFREKPLPPPQWHHNNGPISGW